jgi:hypothetical protein
MGATRMGFMVDRCIDPARVSVLVDLGYVNETATRERGKALMAAGVSRRNFSVEGFGRLLVRFPPTKAPGLLERFPIVEGETYFMATHHWRGLRQGERIAELP